ncbi:MAG: hypothetical protein R3F34_02385 [Planctomycetota bacterium]
MTRAASGAVLAAVLAACAGPGAGSEAPVVGPVLEVTARDGTPLRYEWVPDFAVDAEGVPLCGRLGNTHGAVVVDGAGEVLFDTDTQDAIVVLRRDGVRERAFGAEFAGGLHGMRLVRDFDPATGSPRETLFLAHHAHGELARVALDGTVLWKRGYPEESGLYRSAGEFHPTAIDVAPDGTLWVADGYGFSFVHHFDANGTWLEAFGGMGEEDGRFRTCHGLSIDASGARPELWVADRENGRLQVFDVHGEHLRTIAGDFRRPCSVERGPDGLRVVADLAGRVTLLDADGTVLGHLGDQPDAAKRANNGVPPEQWTDGEFVAPHHASFDAQGNLYVVDWVATGRISKLRRLRGSAFAGGVRDRSDPSGYPTITEGPLRPDTA